MSTMPSIARARRVAGMSLIELMVAMVLSFLVILGLVSMMDSVGVVNRTQDGMARLQENGRFAITRLAEDLRAATSQHCSTFSSASSNIAATGFVYQDRTRALRAKFNASGTPWWFGPVPAAAAAYWISPRFMLFGSECDAATCTPAVNTIGNPTTGRGGVSGPTALPVMGTGNGQRGRGADVLTLRYLSGPGVRILGQSNFLPGDAGGNVQLALDPATAATLDLAGVNGDGVWITDCSTTLIARATLGGSTLTLNNNYAAGATTESDFMPRVDETSDARVFNLGRDLQQVTYYLQLKNDPNTAGRMISSLMRRQIVGGAVNTQELVEGVERLDFLYGVEDNVGQTRYLTAAQVDALTTCPPQPYGLPTNVAENGCGWRAVKSIEIFMLVNTVADSTVGGDDEFRYSFRNDGTVNAAGTFENPEVLGTLRNGLPPGRMLRREFRTLVSLRGYNF